MNIKHLHLNFQPLNDVPDDLDPKVNPIIATHFFGILVEFEPAKALTAESSRIVHRRVA